ncbi:hypothetical protein BH10ACT11_BH10ACT11_14080 [soil metagenome]
MSVLVVGSSEPVGALTSALAGLGVEAEARLLGSPGGSSAEALAEALVEVERLVVENEPQGIVAVGPGDAATAAALVAGKTAVRLILLAEPGELDDEGGAVAELSAQRLPLPHGEAEIVLVAEAIASAL